MPQLCLCDHPDRGGGRDRRAEQRRLWAITGAVYRSVFSGNGTGLDLHAAGPDGFLLEASHFDINASMAIKVGSAEDALEMIGSTATGPTGRGIGTWITNSGYLYLFRGNVLDELTNTGIESCTNGTNVIGFL